MSLEASIEKLTAAIEAATGVLVALGAGGVKASAAASAPAPAAAAAPAAEAPKRGRPTGSGKAAAPAPAPAADDGGLGEDDGGLGGDDGGLGGGEEAVTPEQAKDAVFAYRDKACKLKGRDNGLAETRTLMRKFVASVDAISADNAGEIFKAFNDAAAKLK